MTAAGACPGPAHAGVAQLVEQLSCKQQVIGSIPVAGSIVFNLPPPGRRRSGAPDASGSHPRSLR